MTTDEQLIEEVLKSIDAGTPRERLFHDTEHGEAFADILRTIDMLEGAGTQILPPKELLKKILSGAPLTHPSPTVVTNIPEPIKGRVTTNPTSKASMRMIWRIMVPVLVAVVLIVGGLYVWNTEEKSKEYAAEGTAPAPTTETAPAPAPQVAGSVTTVAATGNVDDAVKAISNDSIAEAAVMQQELSDSSSDSLNGDAQAMGGFDSSYGNY
jgi:hypothetical protein